MILENNKTLKYACYTINLCMSVVGNLSPVLFLTFHTIYGISYSFLGFLIFANFVTQLSVDLLFSFFSHKFNIQKVLRLSPIMCASGILIYSLIPFISSDLTYIGLVIGTIIFAVSGGVTEVLISPVIAAIPSDDPDREMSRLHSVYAWGVVFVIVFSTIFLFIFGNENWQYMSLLYVVFPLTASVLFFRSQIPDMEVSKNSSKEFLLLKKKEMWLSVLAIFLGGAAECTMAQWSSSYLEQSFQIKKIYGDIFGVALFSVTLGIGRTLYSKIGKNIEKVLLFSAAGTTVCYLIAVITENPMVALSACAMTGLCVSMCWPGNLIVIAKRFPQGGVFMYAMMAAGGDLGGAIIPQFVGIITDAVIKSPNIKMWAEYFSILPEQLGLKVGMAFATIFPAAAMIVFSIIFKKEKNIDYQKL